MIFELEDYVSGGVIINRRAVGTFRGPSPAVNVPPGVLRAGKHYAAQISAVSEEVGADPSIFALPLRSVAATTYTGIFTP